MKKRIVQGFLAAGAACLLVAAPAHALKVKTVEVVNVVEGDSVESVDAMCPDGFKVTGGGGFSNGAYQETKLQDSYPIDGADNDSKPDDGWRATVWNTAAMSRNTEAQAICAKAKVKYEKADIGNGTGGKRVSCPDGTTVSGGGVDTFETFGFPYDILESIPVKYDPNSARARAWFAFTGDGGLGLIGATVHAACIVDSAANVKARREFFAAPAGDQSDGEVLCSPKEKLTGVGGVLGTQQGAIVTMFGADSPADANLDLDDGGSVTVDNQGGEELISEAYALCAK